MNTRSRKRARSISYSIPSDSDASDDDYDDDYEYENSNSNEDYIPNDDLSNLKKTNKIAYKNFMDIKLEIIKSEPKAITILNEPLLTQDRVKLFQLYEVYKTVEPNTEIWLELRRKVNKLFVEAKNNYAQYCKYTSDQHFKMEKQIKLLDSYDANSDMEYKILHLQTSVQNKQIIYSKYKELRTMLSHDDERTKILNWLNWAISIPYDKIKTFPFTKNTLTRFLRRISNTLDQELYGMEKVKERILLFASSKIQNPHMKKCSLGLIGPPGTGKTFVSRLLAQVLNFPFEQISLGGISNPDFLKGHEYTYVGAQPGEIVKCLRRMKYKNGILFLDEFDKISSNLDLCSALLHITDPVQNSDFRDKFLSGLQIDLSHLWFIYSMNDLPQDSALCNRIDLIEVPGYSLEDKIQIVIDYLFPKALKNINTPPDSISLSVETATYLIKNKTDWKEDVGIRNIEKRVNQIVTKIDFLIKHQDNKGKLRGFNMSFEIGKKVKYPVNLTIKMINIFIRN